MKTLIACLVLFIGGIAAAEPVKVRPFDVNFNKPASLTYKELNQVQAGIESWLQENHDDPANVEFVGHYDCWQHKDDPNLVWFSRKYRVTNSQGIKRLYNNSFHIYKTTGKVVD